MNKSIKYFLIILISANLFNFWIISEVFTLKEEKVSFLDVGQGDAELIQSLAGNILIDAGPSSKIVTVLGEVFPFFDQVIDLFILSHPEKDHFYGMLELLDRYKVRAVMLNNVFHNNSQYQKLLQELYKRNILVIQGFQGIKVSLGESYLQIIYPETMVSSAQNPNDFCLVAYLNLNQNSFLFTGDIGSQQEQKLISFLEKNKQGIRVLKVAHHGSRFSSSKEFLNAFEPNYAVIEVGKNSYGHPHPEVLERLEQIGAKILRTDLEGTIRLKLDRL